MYQIDPINNRIKKLSVKRFADLGLQERVHLQEWIANAPESIDEELLIIQKEFDDFDETKDKVMYQHFSGHTVKLPYAAILNPRAINNH